MSAAPAIVYLLCFVASGSCTYLLGRAYLESKEPLLLWTGLCFLFLSLNAFLVFMDLIIFPEVDLYFARQGLTLVALTVLLYGFIWESE